MISQHDLNRAIFRITYDIDRLEAIINVFEGKKDMSSLPSYMADGPLIIDATLILFEVSQGIETLKELGYRQNLSDDTLQTYNQLNEWYWNYVRIGNSIVELHNYWRELMVEYERDLNDLENMIFEELFNTICIRNSIHAIQQHLEVLNEKVDLSRLAFIDEKLRVSFDRKTVAPFSAKEQIRIFKPQSMWWNYRDLY